MPVRIFVAAFLAHCLCSVAPGLGRAEGASEEQVKAAYLFNFSRFVEWPDSAFASPSAPILIGIIGDESFAHILDGTIAGKKVGQRPVRVELYAGAKAAAGSHILFVPSGRDGLLDEVVDVVKGSAVFTVASDESFTTRGGMANFFRVGNKIRFAINEGAARGAGLKVSSRLLRLAKVVECCEGTAKVDWR